MILGLGKKKDLPPHEAIKAGNLRKMAWVYMHREQENAVVAGNFKDALYYDTDDAVQVCDTTSDIVFGEVVRDRFAACDFRKRTEADKRRKKTEWPAFKASGSKSVAAFERDYIACSIYGVNETNHTARLETQEVQWGVKLTVLVAVLNTSELGGALKKLKKHFLKWEKT